MNLSAIHLKTFLAKAAIIKPNVLYPSLDSIHVEVMDGTVRLIKTNMNIFCSYTYPDAYQTPDIKLLLNESAVKTFLDLYQPELLNIDLSKPPIATLRSGKNKLDVPMDAVETFPAMPVAVSEPAILNSDHLNAINIAQAYTQKVGVQSLLSFVHIGERGIFGSNGSYVYFSATNEPLPTAILNPEACQVLGTVQDEARFTISEKFNFIEEHEFRWAVIATEFKTFDYGRIVDMATEGEFTVTRTELMQFCTLVQNTCKKELPVASWEGAGLFLSLRYIDGEFNRNAEAEVAMEGTVDPPAFKLSVPNLNAALKALPYEKLTFRPMGPHYKITTAEAPEYTGVVSGLKL